VDIFLNHLDKIYLKNLLHYGVLRGLHFQKSPFAHGFLVISPEVILSYKVDNYYSKENDSRIRYDDLLIEIDWGIDTNDIVLSEKDISVQTLKEWLKTPASDLF